MFCRYTISSAVGLAKKEDANFSYIQEWGNVARKRNRALVKYPTTKRVCINTVKRHIALRVK